MATLVELVLMGSLRWPVAGGWYEKTKKDDIDHIFRAIEEGLCTWGDEPKFSSII